MSATATLKRPGFGKQGKIIQLKSNFFRVSFPSTDVFAYNFKTEPICTALTKRLLWAKIKEEVADKSTVAGMIYDCQTSKVFCTKDCKIPLNLKLRVMLNDVVYLVVFELDRIIPMNLLNEALYDETLEVPEYCVEVLKAVFRYQPSYHFYVVGQSYFSRQNCMTLSAGAECWSGYHHSVQVGSGKTLLNLDISATTFIEAVNMVKLFFEVVGKPIDNVAETDRSKFEKFVKGVKFSINHRGPMKRKYRVTGITKQSAEALTFQPNPEHPDEITVKDYFQQRYGIALKYSRLPCIKVVTSQENMPNKTIFFPLEVCDVVEGQRHSKKLNEIQTAKMIKQTCQTPERRKENIATGFSAMGYDKDETLKAFGLNINTEMITVSGRVLDAPELSFHPTSQEQHCIPKEGGWNMKNKKFPIGGTLESWIVCQFGCDDKKHYVGNFVKELVGTAISLGVKVLTPEPAILNFPSLLAPLELNLKMAWAAVGQSLNKQPQLLLCVLPNSNASLYGEIKRVCDTILGVASQCVLVKHTLQPKRQYCANVVLKINAKLGGLNSFLSSTQIPFISEIPTIVFGADIIFPLGSDPNRKSTASVVASMDAKAAHYVGCSSLQPVSSSTIVEMKSMVKELLLHFYRSNNRMKPERAIFYRDGISDTKFGSVLEHEVRGFKEACNELENGYNPQLTYVIVQKRHHARFFNMDGETKNVPAGTIVEKEVTDPNFNFYLCSHAGLQGTSRAARYHVLFDENEFSPDAIQELSYRLCYTYARCTRSVSVVPATYYAHLVAFRARFHLPSDETEELIEGASIAPIKAPLHELLYFI